MVGRFFAPAAKKVAAIFSRRVPEWKKATVKGLFEDLSYYSWFLSCFCQILILPLQAIHLVIIEDRIIWNFILCMCTSGDSCLLLLVKGLTGF
jgi:hypothetical protein